MQETWDRSLGQDDPLEKEMAIQSSILAWEIPWTEGAWWATVHGIAQGVWSLAGTFGAAVCVGVHSGRLGEPQNR